ncbi:unnamed protein product, partial [Adineta ricciae]
LCSGIIPRILSTWNVDMTNTNQSLCKLRIFIYFTALTISLWLIVLATVDRWLSSCFNVTYRNRSTLKNAQRGIIFIVFISSVMEIQQLFCYEANLTYTPLKCYSKTVTCAILSDLSFAFISVLIPLSLMFIFGQMIISNVRRTQTVVRPATNINMTNTNTFVKSISMNHTRFKKEKKSDRRLLFMLLVQVLINFSCMIPFALSKLYSTFTRNILKSAFQITIENFIFNLLLLFSFIPSGLSFYLYTLTGGQVFRKALINVFRK